MLAACSSVRCDRSLVLAEISDAAFETSLLESAMLAIVSCNCAMAALKSSCTFLYSSTNSSVMR